MYRLTIEQLSWNMSRIQGENMCPEIAIRSLLHRNDFRFRLQETKLLGKPDIVLLKFKAVKFVQGYFLRRHENCKHTYIPKLRNDFWDSKFQLTIQRDVRQIEAVSEICCFPVVVWEREVKKKPAEVVQRVEKLLKKHFLKIQGGA